MFERIKVLWIDDQPTDGFIDKAAGEEIDIEVATTVSQGMAMLDDQTNTFEAIILDANCKIADDGEEEDLSALSHAIAGIYARRLEIPWFVYTAGGYEGFELIEKIIPQNYRNWDENAYYTKPGANEIAGQGYNELFSAIKKAVAESEITKTKRLFRDVFDVYDGQDILGLLMRRDDNSIRRDTSVPNQVRLIADNICYRLRDVGINPSKGKQSNVIGDYSFFLAKDTFNQFIPKHVQGALHYLSLYYCNPGSHGEDPKQPLPICRHIKMGLAPFANQMGIYALIGLIQWFGTLPLYNDEEMKPMRDFFNNIETAKSR